MWDTSPDEGLKDFIAAPPCPAGDIVAAEAALGAVFPEDYKAFLRLHDGAVGWVGNTRLELWRAAELLPRNSGRAAGTIGFGGDGVDILLAFDTRRSPFAVVMLAPVGSIRVADSFAGLFYRMTQPGGSLFARA